MIVPFSMRTAAPALVWTTGLYALVLLSCDSSSIAPLPGTCVEAGAQCQLLEGPLGVCERSPCAPNVEPPCFHCTPQH